MMDIGSKSTSMTQRIICDWPATQERACWYWTIPEMYASLINKASKQTNNLSSVGMMELRTISHSFFQTSAGPLSSGLSLINDLPIFTWALSEMVCFDMI